MAASYELKAKKSGIIFAEYYVDGERQRVSCKTRDRREARQRADLIVNGGGPSSNPSAAPKVGAITMAVLFDRMQQTDWSPRECKSQATIRSNIKILNTYIGDELITDVTHPRLERLAADLFSHGYKAGTVDRKLNAVGAALGRATIETDKQGRPWLAGKPRLPKITVNNFKDRVVTREEEQAIFKAIFDCLAAEPTRDWQRYHCLIRFLLDTGCRLSEALNLTTKDVETRDVNGRMITFAVFPRYKTKSGKPRQIPLTDAVARNLSHLSWGSPGGSYFKISPATAWYMWDRSIRAGVKAAGFDIDDVTLHTMRHTCLTRLAKSGKLRLEQISDWAGHSSVQITRDRYLHYLPEDQIPVLDVLNAMAASSGMADYEARDLAPAHPLAVETSEAMANSNVAANAIETAYKAA